MLVFGPPWGSDAYDAAAETGRLTPTPVGVRCAYCHQAVVDGDQGYVMPYAGDDDLGEDYRVPGMGGPGWSAVVDHRECLAAQTAGHIVGACTCTGWTPGTRETAREVQRRLDARAAGFA